jgi:hypothetical protein
MRPSIELLTTGRRVSLSGKTLFDDIDSFKVMVRGRNLFPAFHNHSSIRRRILELTILAGLIWAYWGFDSTIDEGDVIVTHFILNPLGVVTASFQTLWNYVVGLPPPQIYTDIISDMAKVYGLGNHWSAPFIYGVCFVALSAHLERVGVVRSLNFFVTTGLCAGNIGFFELLWNRLYSWLQNQPWTLSLSFLPQVKNIAFFVLFVILGVASFLILRDLGYRVTFPWWKQGLVAAAVFLWFLWVWYPFPLTQIVVATSAGPWSSSHLFPQTFYAVMVNPGYSKAFYAPNDWLHLLNVLCKGISAAAVASLSMVVKVKEERV